MIGRMVSYMNIGFPGEFAELGWGKGPIPVSFGSQYVGSKLFNEMALDIIVALRFQGFYPLVNLEKTGSSLEAFTIIRVPPVTFGLVDMIRGDKKSAGALNSCRTGKASVLL